MRKGETRLTPELVDRIVSAIQDGKGPVAAAVSCGVSNESMKRYLKRGLSEDVKDYEYAEFRRRVILANGGIPKHVNYGPGGRVCRKRVLS